ncbi:TIGR02391 family protein [Pseudanabaena sp. FACHB-2040]|uniref:TIGR02391 family protein n=1 Tax=Pseudanabaena sp. FACHB-2040 TaxID=2692859 RepID=UPI001683F010|nr:TIGR02391 family protein [Pseudanabaena sp. FACHB-2040]MBD2256650.1 hypothetical protein [Pseudanabaena sp. FACHB-2040]
MQFSTLTEKQKNTLIWIVERVRAGALQEERITWVLFSGESCHIQGYGGSIPKIRSSTLDALIEHELLVCSLRSYVQYDLALNYLSYQAVDTNFGNLELLSSSRLVPPKLMEHLDPELWERIRFAISAGDDPTAWDQAIRQATTVLEERLRRLGNIDAINPTSTGDKIVNKLFEKDGPWGKQLNGKHQAYRDLYAGMIGVFRNSYAHRFMDPSPEEGAAIMLFIDLLLKKLDELTEAKEE